MIDDSGKKLAPRRKRQKYGRKGDCRIIYKADGTLQSRRYGLSLEMHVNAN